MLQLLIVASMKAMKGQRHVASNSWCRQWKISWITLRAKWHFLAPLEFQDSVKACLLHCTTLIFSLVYMLVILVYFSALITNILPKNFHYQLFFFKYTRNVGKNAIICNNSKIFGLDSNKRAAVG